MSQHVSEKVMVHTRSDAAKYGSTHYDSSSKIAASPLGRHLAKLALLLSIIAIMLGAYTRLTDAGLGCPDWPGCYGQLIVPHSDQHITEANNLYPARPVVHAKAWAEMVHRYVAGTLGLCIVSLCILHFKNHSPHRRLACALALLIVGQAALGMWTVTLGLKPIIVTAHLLGGFTTFALLLTLNLRLSHRSLRFNIHPIPTNSFPRTLLITAFSALILQISLGGWTAANYAATVCIELPICQGDWISYLNFPEALQLWGHEVTPYREGVSAYEYAQHITPDVKITIHVMHRIGAIITSVLVLLCVWQLRRKNLILALGLFTLLTTQVSLGIFNVITRLPLYTAVLHNIVAALLLGWMILILTQTKPQHANNTPFDAKRQSHEHRNRKSTHRQSQPEIASA